MKWNFILVMSSLLGGIKSGGPPVQDSPIPQNLLDTTSANLAKKNITINPFVVASPGLLADVRFSEQEKEIQVNETTANVLTALQNPERFCRLTTAMQKASCDRSGAFVPLKIEVATEELTIQNIIYRGIYFFSYGLENMIALATTYLLNAVKQQYVTGHELWHFFWRTQNIANCTAEDDLHKTKRFADTKLTLNEMNAAPYNSANKAAFIQAFEQGLKRLSQLKQNIKKFRTNANYAFIHRALKKKIDLLEEEAKCNPLTQTQKNSGSSLLQLLNQLESELKTMKNSYAKDMKYYEQAAALAMLDLYPETRDYLFRELQEWYERETPGYLEYQNCIREIKAGRSGLSYRKNTSGALLCR